MIFVGDGALLRRAVVHAAERGHPVDLVCSEDPLDAGGTRHLRLSAHDDINAHADVLADASTDGVVWSLNNRRIFREPLLSRDLRILNVHNGLLPRHRGLPSVAVAFALLSGEREYGATLHEVDAGIDTGRVLAEHRFGIAPGARHFQVMLRGVRASQDLFERALPTVAAGAAFSPAPAPSPPRAYYGTRSLTRLTDYRDHPGYAAATDLGPFTAHAPELAAAITAIAVQPSGLPARTQ
ncbi:formyltransferase family protein [Streptomyces lavendulae]|uniref:formyltransferase family protein n=1 Tax=Streptomyces lavendulae TaxID=1914 RepID=UPI00371B7341